MLIKGAARPHRKTRRGQESNRSRPGVKNLISIFYTHKKRYLDQMQFLSPFIYLFRSSENYEEIDWKNTKNLLQIQTFVMPLFSFNVTESVSKTSG